MFHSELQFKMDHNSFPVSSISFMLCLCYFLKFTICVDDPAYLTGGVSINCGSVGTSAAHIGRQWLGDTDPRFASSVQIKGKSTISRVARDSVSADPIPYEAARISRSGFAYVFLVSPGEKFIRLHFKPTLYKGFQKYKDLFTVEAGPFTLLSNFSASLTTDALGLTSIIKEFCISVEENQPLHIAFTPVSSLSGDTYAFLNGIEIITVPLGLSYFHNDGDIGAQVVGRKSQWFYIDNSTVLEMIRTVNTKRDGYVSSGDDISYVFGILKTAPKKKANLIDNITWKIPVDVGFRYLARLHFSDVGVKRVQETGSMNFKVLINEMIAYSSIDFVRERDTSNIIVYKDYMVMSKGPKGVKHHILVSFKPYGVSIDGYVPFTGFEILKLSNFHNSLACPNPSPPALDSPPRTVQFLLSVLRHRNSIVTISITIITLANIIVHMLGEIWEASCMEEEIKPSAKAERSCRRYKLAEIQLATRDFSHQLILGKGGFGTVYKGLIDKGKQTIAVKRLKSDSRQGEHEFLAEIETLSQLRHNNLVSLIGYCNEQKEMILVYEYMAGGTLGDHLYKLTRKGSSCTSLTWKQRLNICIGAGRGLDYLHTGNGVIHRDVKASNILLDEKFTPKVADFGLVKHENLSNLQSHVSTKVKGTFGYLDPTYVRTGKLTRKSDTYAFGVVLLEVLCGRPALDLRVSEAEQILSQWAREKIREGEVELIVDSSLIKEISPNSLKSFVEIAERCLDEEPKKRPTMTQVVRQLESALEQQDLRESSVPKEIMVPSIDERTPTSPPKGHTNNQINHDYSSYQIKEGSKALSYKPSRKLPWDAFWKKLKPSRKNQDPILSDICKLDKNLPKFDWSMISFATDNFSNSNFMGEGAFCSVHKGVLPVSRQIVAVKKFKADVDQRYARELVINEFFIAQKIQHRNILRLLGYCIHKERLVLVHEFMENKSLSDVISGKFQYLRWTQIFKIIMGIARGVAYLHEDSGLRIIHRDIKPRNILLDIDMNPKISGFHHVKTLEEDSSSKTSAVRGSVGYICPEYWRRGRLSIKSDLYSFGVVVLEIVRGRRGITVHSEEYQGYIVNIARNLWLQDKKAFGLVDESIRCDALTPVEKEEVLRCIKVGLLCTLSRQECRPTMPHVIKLLDGALSVDLQEMESLLGREVNESECDDVSHVSMGSW
ncbi:putative receptor-like protein kinase At5g39000 isoform X2 [Primulina huaijiensis]|uniref:putative receptor-like protein kinase At5g39000 isoform X2 n=1 Tax=Primulina huaijiensis TaxID=1492673 RepID=UPI003CC6F6A5